MAVIEKHLVFRVPTGEAYAQWLRLEDFAELVDEVQEVERLDAKRSRWTVQLGSQEHVFVLRLVEIRPGQCLAWQTDDPRLPEGEVRFRPIACTSLLPEPLPRTEAVAEPAKCCQVTLRLVYQPETLIERSLLLLGLVERHLERMLVRLKHHLEQPVHGGAGHPGNHRPK